MILVADSSSRSCPVAVVEANELTLPADKFVNGRTESGEVLDCDSIHFFFFRESVQLDVRFKESRSHERSLPAFAVLVPFRVAYLLETVVFTDVHIRSINHDFLTYAVTHVEVVLVDRERKYTCFVLDKERFENVSAFIGRNYTTGDDVVTSVRAIADSLDIVCFVLPESLFEVGNGGVGLVNSHGSVCLWVVPIVLTRNKSERHQCHSTIY